MAFNTEMGINKFMTYMTPFERHQFDEQNQKTTYKQNYTTNTNIGTSSNAPRVPFASEVLKKIGQSSPHPSELFSWYHREDAKRRQKIQNEIDLNDIRAAAKGVFNKWHKAVIKFPEVFESFLTDKPFDWNKMLEARNLALNSN